MTQAAKGPATVGAVNRAGDQTVRELLIVAHPQRRASRKHRHRSKAIAPRRGLFYPESAAATSVARFGDRKHKAHNAPIGAFSFARISQWRCVLGAPPSGLPVALWPVRQPGTCRHPFGEGWRFPNSHKETCHG